MTYALNAIATSKVQQTENDRQPAVRSVNMFHQLETIETRPFKIGHDSGKAVRA
jgi:hypothetical protein